MTSEVKLTQAGQERLHRLLEEEKVQLDEAEAFIQQQLLCKCDLDQATLRDARLKKQDLEQHVKELEDTLERARLAVPPEEVSLVDLGAIVTLLHEDTGEHMVVQLVSSLEAGVAPDTTMLMRISDTSPVGQQLRGQHKGDLIQVKTGSGRNVQYRILDVHYWDTHF
jgi:transcription elongation factor GreA